MFALSDFLVSLWRRWQNADSRHQRSRGNSFDDANIRLCCDASIPPSLLVDSDPIDRGFGDPQATSYWKAVERDADANDIRRAQRQY